MADAGSIAVGSHWEGLALDFLKRQGLQEVARNYRCRMGEIDLVMSDGDCLVFVEVRYRRASRFATAAGSIDSGKRRKIASTAGMFLARHPRFSSHTVRFDVVAFDASVTDQCTLQWLQDAFRPET